MPNGKRNKYGIFQNGELIKEGFCREISRHLHVLPSTLNSHVHTGTPIGEFEVRITKVIDQRYYFRKAKEEFDVLDYLYRHLKEYGNTVINDDPSQYIEELERRLNGTIFVSQREDVDDLFNYETSTVEAKRHHGRRRPYYLLEIKYGISEIQK